MATTNRTNPASDMWHLSMEELRARFYDFPSIPLHVHLGIAFEREHPDGPAICTLPASPDFTWPDGHQSHAAIYTIGEVSGGVAGSDFVVPHAVAPGKRPVSLTRKATFAPLGRARGSMTGEREVGGDPEASVAEKPKRLKADGDNCANAHDEDPRPPGPGRA